MMEMPHPFGLTNEPGVEDRLRQEHARLGALQQVVLGLTSTLDLNEVLQRVAEMAQTLSNSAHAHIYLFDPKRDELALAASHWSPSQRSIPLKPRRSGITYTVAHTGTAQFIQDSKNDPTYADIPNDQRPGAIACLPLIKADRVLGTLNLGYWQPYRFDVETRNFLDLMARHAALAIDNTRHYAEAKQHAEELAHRVQELVIVNELSQAVNSLDVNQVMRHGLDLIKRNFQATYCTLSLYDPETRQLAVTAIEPADDPALGIAFGADDSPILREAIVQQRPFVWYDDPHIVSTDPLLSYLRSRETRKLFATPMILQNIVRGFVSVDPGEHDITADQITLLQTIGNQILIAMENTRLYQVAVEKAKLEREFQLARDLQQGLIPRQPPLIDGWDIAALWKPARLVSGDFYDFFPVAHSDCTRQGLVIGDVSDKGVPAAMFMALVRGTLRTLVASAPAPADCITQANRILCADTENGMFATLCYAQLDPTAGILEYVNAGHNPPLLCRADDDQIIEITRTGMAIGVDPNQSYAQHTLELRPGDFVLLWTDGISDATNAQEHEFGIERLYQVVQQHRHASSAEIVAAVDQAVCTFIAGEPSFDDITVVVLKRNGEQKQ